jgi:uncharacterized membrane protein
MNQSLTEFKRPITRIFKMYHTTIMTIIIALLIGAGIFRLSIVFTLSTEKGVEGYTPVSKANGNFDQKTINRIDDLKSSTDSTTALEFPSRPSPFTE